jgi:hypothetical protein
LTRALYNKAVALEALGRQPEAVETYDSLLSYRGGFHDEAVLGIVAAHRPRGARGWVSRGSGLLEALVKARPSPGVYFASHR